VQPYVDPNAVMQNAAEMDQARLFRGGYFCYFFYSSAPAWEGVEMDPEV
jgi:hypothetical protein